MSDLRGWRYGWLALLAVTAAAYARLWFVEFSWDDEALVVDNQVTGSLANVGELFARDLWSTTKLSWLKSGYYRPLFLVSIALDRALFGLSSAAAHAHSLLWHLLAVGALHHLLRRLVTPAAALLGAALFALHPLQSEVLALIAARNDSMAAAMTLAALGLALERGWDARRGALASLLFLGALLSKESAVLAPIMLLALDLARWGRPGSLARYLPFAAAGAAYGALRAMAGVDEGLAGTTGNFAVITDNLAQIAAQYASLVAWPWPLTPARHVSYLPPLAEVLPGALALLALVAAALAWGRDRRLVIAGLAWAGLAWAPSLAATLDKGLLGERYLYFPLAGLALALAGAWRTPPAWAAGTLAIPCVVALQLRLPSWQSSRSVWEAAHRDAPDAFTAAGLGWYYHRDKRLDEALPLLVMAVEGDPPYRDACDLVLSAHLAAKRVREAARVGERALSRGACPARGLFLEHYAMALAASGRWTEAVGAAAQHPGGPQAGGLAVLIAAMALHREPALVRQVALQGGEERLQQVARLLRLGGRPERAARVLAPPKQP